MTLSQELVKQNKIWLLGNFFLVIKNFIENGPEKVVNPGIVSGKEIRELHWAHSLFYPPARKMMKTHSWFG